MVFLREDLVQYIVFKTSRSGGKGGQNVNKVSTKVEINFDFESAAFLSEEEKALLRIRLINRLNAEGKIQVVSDEERSQLLNKERALNKLLLLIQASLVVQKPRKKTKPRKSDIERRLKDKQKRAIKKLNRRGGIDY
ncbi:alternative ribosome rescue aminoacyl-tRNA hydrolase ArfB [Desertivirga brevis]|uniref:alternative ribosome rescue aminoacyl-tRNA hydrolase ArfB n=1 Tax=Desertivirga brevis TaxID=2810310 RepID=UPI001A96F510|nr:alternative ribosome rescue aminoacyl-tRNA hydrolase ArfB [Pedobacter sp. SYSU D00873]